MKIKHLFISQRSDNPDKTKIRASNWNAFHADEIGKEVEIISSSPPPGMFKVVNLFVDPLTKKLLVQYDDQT